MAGGRKATARRARGKRRDVRVSLPDGRSYVVRIVEDGFGELPAFLRDAAACASRLVVLADQGAWKAHGEAFESALARIRGGGDALVLRIPRGERAKSFESYQRVLDRLIRERIDRSGLIVAFGGGVVGDLGGFVAASYLRGIDFVQVPTTLLSQVDSSVGGKTGINHPRGKNLIGAFHQPKAVFAAMSTLGTLSDREYRSGMAEVLKYGVIRDRALFGRLERDADEARSRDAELLAWLVERSVSTKARIVEADERESGERALLNLGHTLGHAIEQSGGYARWAHGEAVAVGTVAAARVSERHGWMSAHDADRVERLVEALGLPTRAPGLTVGAVRAAIGRDKKVRAGQIRFVAPTGIGRAELRWMPVDVVAGELVTAAAA